MKEFPHLTYMNLPVRKLIKGVCFCFTNINDTACIISSVRTHSQHLMLTRRIDQKPCGINIGCKLDMNVWRDDCLLKQSNIRVMWVWH